MRRGQEKGKYHDERHCARNAQRSSFGIRLLTYTPFPGVQVRRLRDLRMVLEVAAAVTYPSR